MVWVPLPVAYLHLSLKIDHSYGVARKYLQSVSFVHSFDFEGRTVVWQALPPRSQAGRTSFEGVGHPLPAPARNGASGARLAPQPGVFYFGLTRRSVRFRRPPPGTSC